MKQKRVLVCSFVAIASGLTGAYFGGQGNLVAQIERCDRQAFLLPGATNLCQVWITPFAWTEGSLTGLWCGMILGASAAGLATHSRKKEVSRK